MALLSLDYILLPFNYIDIKIHNVCLDEIFYNVAEVRRGRIFTNQNDNILKNILSELLILKENDKLLFRYFTSFDVSEYLKIKQLNYFTTNI